MITASKKKKLQDVFINALKEEKEYGVYNDLMSDIFSKRDRSRIMALIKNKDSGIERLFAKILRRNKVTFLSHVSSVPGKPDYYSRKLKTVFFVDSCFWHGCRYHGSMPKSNRKFWKEKISMNRKRDRINDRKCKGLGLRVVRIWEHSIKKPDFEKEFSDLLKHISEK